MPLAEVQPIYETNFRDIPGMLRRLADDIEAGKWGDVQDTLLILHNDLGVEVFGWGDVDFVRSIGVLELGRARMFEIMSASSAAVRAS